MRELTIIFFCTWKFAATFPVAVFVMKMSVGETLLYTNLGGMLGVFIFLSFSGFLIKTWNGYRSHFHKKKKLIFTPANRRFIKIKKKYGFWGIVILSPVILSIPVGAFLAAKYYGVRPRVFFWLIAGQIFWSVVYTIFYTHVRFVLV
ncbi:MAG TPA: hypothetical protein VK207_03040 [Bacteroidales bacterium]|nr:hypothetical protein [Bacteroidales bacterium]